MNQGHLQESLIGERLPNDLRENKNGLSGIKAKKSVVVAGTRLELVTFGL
jgi:hypothetical protein